MFFATLTWSLCAVHAAAPLFEEEFVFDPEVQSHGHVHASCIIECPNGDLRAVWYENGEEMPPPFYSERKDKSDDVRIGGARKPAGAEKWEAPFVMADTFACSDNNPCLAIDNDQRLWLVFPTLVGVPKNTWGSALLQYKISSNYQRPGVPDWDRESIIIPHPTGFKELLDRIPDEALSRLGPVDMVKKMIARRLDDPFRLRFGWMLRAHPLVRSDGAVLIPLANENFSIAAMAITEDGGATWKISSPVPHAGIIQPTVVEWPDESMTAFFRSGDDVPEIRRSESTDGGMTWSPLVKTSLVHPGSGFEAILLEDGRLAIVYNDKVESPRDRLAISMSDDRGKTWKWKRTIENIPGGRFDYPSVIQAKDGSLHVTFSYYLKTVKHVRFNTQWVEAGD